MMILQKDSFDKRTFQDYKWQTLKFSISEIFPLFWKSFCLHFIFPNRHLVSGSLDGKLIIWDTWSGNKVSKKILILTDIKYFFNFIYNTIRNLYHPQVRIIPLQSSWVMTVAYSSSGNFVACGGMDNMCTVYDVNSRDSAGAAKIRREMMGFEGFLSCCRFLDDDKLVTGSADMKM